MKKLLILLVVIVGILFINIISFANIAWSEWQDEEISSSDTTEVETRQVPSSYIMVSFVCGVSGYPRGYYSWNKGSFRCDYTFEWTASEFDNAIVYHEGDYFDFYDGTAADGLIGGGGDAYVKDSDWYIPCYVRETKYKTQYRYKEIQKEVVNTSTDNENHKSQTTQPTTKAITREKTYETSKSSMKEREDIVKENKKSKGKKMNGGAKVWNGTSDNQNQVSENTDNSIIENDNFIVMDEVVNGDNVTTIIPDMSKIQYSPIDGIFNQSSYNDYNKEVALFAAELSEKAYKGGHLIFEGSFPSELVSTLENQYGFSKVKTYNYTTSDTLNGSYINANCFAIGHRILSDDSVILCIVARGSSNFGEIFADAYNLEGTTNVLNLYVFNDIYNFSKQIGIGVNKYFEINPELKNVKNMKVLITGHSLGGAAANLYSAMFQNDVVNGKWLNKSIKTSDIFTYTFGAIKVIDCNSKTNMESGYENIYNIYNYYDTFGPNGGMCFYSASSPYQKFGKTLIYQDERFRYNEGFGEFNNHEMKNYIDAVTNYDFTRINNSSLNNIPQKNIDLSWDYHCIYTPLFQNFINDSRFRDGVSWNGDKKSQDYLFSRWWGYGCFAYCQEFAYYCFGKIKPKDGEIFYDATQIRAGDNIYIANNNGEHWFVCLGRMGDDLYVAEGNYNGKVRITKSDYKIINSKKINGTSYDFNYGFHYIPNIKSLFLSDRIGVSNSLVEVTQMLAGRTIRLFSKETNCFVTDSAEFKTVHADGDNSDGDVHFMIEGTSDGWIGLKKMNGNYLSVKDQGLIKIAGQNITSNEKFKIYQFGDSFYLLNQKENKFIQVINDGIQIAKPLRVNRNFNDGVNGATWERFDILITDGK